MNWLVLFVLGTTGALVTAACLTFLFLRSRFHRVHRVDPAVATDAPMSWIADPRTPARLHRRLVHLGRTASAVAEDHRPRSRRLRRDDESGPVHAAAVEIRAQAVSLDARLARLALLQGPARRESLREIDRQVQQLERTCGQLVELAVDHGEPARLRGDEPAVDALSRRVDHLADAHRELLALDDDAGLRPDRTVHQPAEDRPTELIAVPPPPPPTRRRSGRA